uniref:Zgc:113531 n=1 Tax=Gasterosteus aculeatus aculeatus TaxID=481459 RepID=A0AAQ4PSA3_GASAC
MMKAQRKNPDFLLLNIFCQPSRALPYTQRLSRMNFGLVNLQTSPSAAGPGGFILCNFATVGLSLQMKELEMWEKVSRRAGRPRWCRVPGTKKSTTGKPRSNGQRITCKRKPSECEQCTCDSDGIARCLVADCAPPPCVNPVYQPGKCCPECRDGPNCYVDASRDRVIPAGEPVWVDSCTKCRCHDGQDAGYWEGNRLATCSRLKNCTPEASSSKKN